MRAEHRLDQPFGQTEEMIAKLRKAQFAGQKISALLPDPQQGNQPSRYVQYANFVYKRRGTLWEGRFKSSLVDQEQYLLTCYRYIELNPVRANMVEQPQDYRWSSYASHGTGKPDDPIEDHPLYVALGGTAETRGAAYRALFRYQLEDAVIAEIRTPPSTRAWQWAQNDSKIRSKRRWRARCGRGRQGAKKR